MGYAQKLPYYIQPEDYLLLEEKAEFKHEYLDGVIYGWQGEGPLGMAGGSVPHSQVILNIALSLKTQLRGTDCMVLATEVRLHKADKSAYFYPDVVVTCSAADRAQKTHIAEPSVVVEVLSPSTEFFDRHDKFSAYRGIGSLQSYVLVSPERRTVEVFTRANHWAAASSQQDEQSLTEESLSLGTLNLSLRAGDVFDGLSRNLS
jgi:Uma2 family endonuclease